jgi:hypothetical protein
VSGCGDGGAGRVILSVAGRLAGILRIFVVSAENGSEMTAYVVRYKEITVKEITLYYGKEGIEDLAKENVESGHFNPQGAVTLNKYPFHEVISVNGRVKP